MSMPQAIKIFNYEAPPTIGEIYSKLSKKTFKVIENDQNDLDKEITLIQKIDGLRQHAFGVVGALTYYSQKEFESIDGEKFYVVPHGFGFLFSPQNELIIIHGDPNYYIRVLKFFSDILHSGDDLIQSISIEKKQMYELMWKILNMKKGKNNLEEASFFHYGKPLDTLKKLSFTTIPEACGTDHILFKKHYTNCTHWNATVRMFKCNGLLDVDSEKGYLLRLNHDGKFSSSLPFDLKRWNRFVVETVKKVVGF